MANLEVIALDAATPQLRAPGAGDAYAMPRPVVQAVGTLTTDVKVQDVSATWNNAAVTFTWHKVNITDTASAVGSLLMDLQVNGVSKFKVHKNGSLSLASTGAARIYFDANAMCLTDDNGVTSLVTRTDFTFIRYSAMFGWGDPASFNMDLRFYRDAANTFAQRNGVNAQTNRIYGTYTDVSNYRRLAQTMSAAGVAEIKPEGAGTGSAGNVLHISGLPTSNPGAGILWNDAGTVKVGT